MNRVIKKDASPEAPMEIVAHKKQIVKTDAEIDAFIEVRKQFITKVSAICIEGKDYHIIQGKKSLAKGGAEKIASIFKWTAKFDKDQEALEMLGDIKGLVAFKCTLMNGQFVGEGRGAALLTKNGSDPNKTLKMAQKSAFIDAVLRASGLSDFFTQDLEDMPREQVTQNYPGTMTDLAGETVPRRERSFPDSTPERKPTEKQAKLIKDLAIQKKITQEGLKLMAQGLTPSQLIDRLFKYQTQQEIPVIQQDKELEDIGDKLGF